MTKGWCIIIECKICWLEKLPDQFLLSLNSFICCVYNQVITNFHQTTAGLKELPPICQWLTAIFIWEWGDDVSHNLVQVGAGVNGQTHSLLIKAEKVERKRRLARLLGTWVPWVGPDGGRAEGENQAEKGTRAQDTRSRPGWAWKQESVCSTIHGRGHAATPEGIQETQH